MEIDAMPLLCDSSLWRVSKSNGLSSRRPTLPLSKFVSFFATPKCGLHHSCCLLVSLRIMQKTLCVPTLFGVK